MVQVRESLGDPGDVGPHATATVACFLIQEGTSILTQNKKGQIPLQSCTPEKFHGSLRAPTPATASLHLFTATAGHISVK